MAELTYVYHYDFIHNVMSNFFKDTLDYMSYVYPRFEYRLVGTYDKAVTYINSQNATGSEIDKPNLPAIILDPSGDFQLADPNTGGIQAWRFPNLASGMTKRIFNPIYMDEHVRLSPGFSRIKGSMEVIILASSFYEYMDIRILLMQIFGGFDRWLYPSTFNTFIIMPEDLIDYEYSNSVTGETYTVDWTTAGAYETLVKTTNRNEWVFPVTIKPIVKMTGLSDGSEKYGGTDGLAEWRLTLELEYELEAPSFMIVETDFMADNLTLNIHIGSEYSAYPWQPPTNRWISHFSWMTGVTSQTNNTHFELSQESEKDEDIKLIHKIRYFYTYTDADVDSTDDLIIPLEEEITNPILLILNSKHGKLEYWDHWDLDTTNNTIILKVNNVTFYAAELLEINVYKPEDPLSINHSPVITSVPSTLVDIRAGTWTYNVTAVDPDPFDSLLFSLDTYPTGMILNPGSGAIEWNAGVGDLGFEPVTVRVTDTEGLFDTQSFNLEVVDLNVPPQITSTPVTTTETGTTYYYYATAVDDTTGLIWSITSGPTLLVIDSTDGVVSWDTTDGDIGTNSVTIRVTDIYGEYDEQTFDIEVTLAPNVAPISRYQFNDAYGVWGADTMAANELSTFGAATLVSPAQEGAAMASFPYGGYGYTGATFYRTDVNLSGDFPLKYAPSNDEMTMCFWFRSEPIGSSNCTVFSKGVGSSSAYPTDNDRTSFSFQYDSSINQIAIQIYRFEDLGGSFDKTPQTLIYSEAIEPNKWYHIGLTFNATTKAVGMRVFNSTDSTQLLDWSDTFSFAEPFNFTDGIFAIGGEMAHDESWAYTNLGYPDPGFIDDFWVFNTILSSDKIDEIRLGTYTW